MIMTLAAPARAGERAVPSGEYTTNHVFCTGPCLMSALFVHADGDNAATVTLYDSPTAETVRKIRSWTVPAGQRNDGYALGIAERTRTGLYITVSGTGASYDIDIIEGKTK